MGVYIDMEMPKEGFVEILIRDDGTVQKTGQSYRINGTDYYTPYVGEMPVIYQAVSVPPHGRTIDADAFIENECNNCDGDCEALPCDCLNCEADCRCDFIKDIAEAPTIIPAEKGET